MNVETRPYPNFHSARVRDPDDFDHIVVLHTTKEGIMILGGPLKSDPKGPTTVQAYRFNKGKFTIAEAKAWLKEHDIKYLSFEPASEKSDDDLVERRVLWPGNIEARDDGVNGAVGQKHLVGYAALFNMRATIWEGLDERIALGTFTDYLKDDGNDVCALFNHDANWPLGRRSANTLTLTEDEKGLYYDVTLPNTQCCNDLYESIKRGDVKGSSFGFRCLADEYDRSDPKCVLRTIRKVALVDVSPCTFPAYKTTSVSARALDVCREHFDVDASVINVPRARQLTELRLRVLAAEANM